MPPAIPDLLTVSIATKDRPAVLDATLRHLHDFGLGGCPLIICDDGSSPALSPPSLALFPKGRLIHNPEPQGQALARNRIARECATPYLLQLDDDSYPVEGSLEALLEIARDTPDWLAIAIPFEEPARHRSFPVGIDKTKPLRLRAFVGCAALIHVENFLRIGGYATWIERTVEEEELCIRALGWGLGVFTVDALRVRHDVTDVSRNVNSIAYRSIRNWTIVWLVYSPLSRLPVRISRLSLAALQNAWMQRSMSPIRGYVAAYRRFLGCPIARTPMTGDNYQLFLSSPHALGLYPKKGN